MTADAIRRERVHDMCGNDIDVAFDPKTRWLVDHTMVCQACATRDMVRRQLEKEHEAENENPVPGRPAWSDGRAFAVRPASAADLRDARTGRKKLVTRG